ncbi:MAG TPA: peptidyl-prolyl cis-trans isomerase [Anaeromyxobacteraceae bacterium]|nr:peptidyl-prolyl cis-trans isomerase [Anaeromyxobacteraceae bacterium]
MRLASISLGLLLGALPFRAIGAAPDGGKLSGAYAVLKAAPSPAYPDCRATPSGEEVRAPLFSAASAGCPVARVAGDAIMLGELADALGQSHLAARSGARRGAKPRAMDYGPVLERLVDLRLVVLEARRMGLNDLPESREAMAAFQATTLRGLLQGQVTAGVKPDPGEVDKVYRAAVKQWKLRSVMFNQEADAKRFREDLAKGKSFQALAKAAVAAKKAQGGEPGYASAKQLLPELAQAAARLAQGQASQPVKVTAGWVVLEVEGARYPKDAKALAEARAQSLASQQFKAIRGFYRELVKKHATVDEQLLKQLDFEAKGEAGYQALAKDGRVLAAIRGERPVTVADLTGEISKKFFHGIDGPIKEHRVNLQKADTFESLLGSRLFAREAAERKLDQTAAYRGKVRQYERVLALNTFVEKVLVPEVKVTEGEVKARYEQKKGGLTSPAMYRLDGLGFRDRRTAEEAVQKLKGGTDLNWLRASADGRLDPDRQQLRFDGGLVSANALPPGLAKVLAGARSGEYRLFSSEDGAEHYAVRVVEQLPPSVTPYAEAREKLARELEGEKLAAGLKEYAAKLRKVQQVDVLVTRIAG